MVTKRRLTDVFLLYANMVRLLLSIFVMRREASNFILKVIRLKNLVLKNKRSDFPKFAYSILVILLKVRVLLLKPSGASYLLNLLRYDCWLNPFGPFRISTTA